MNKLAYILTQRLLNRKAVAEDKAEIYIYGFELLLSFCISIIIIMIVGAFCRIMWETVAFLAVFVILRSFSGGYHANTYIMCTVVTMTTYGLVMLATQYIEIPIIMLCIVGIIGAVIYIYMAPVQHPNKELTMCQKKRNKIISILLLFTFVIVGIMLYERAELIYRSIFYSLIADISLLFIKSKPGKEDAE